jgi:hypothetical protein
MKDFLGRAPVPFASEKLSGRSPSGLDQINANSWVSLDLEETALDALKPPVRCHKDEKEFTMKLGFVSLPFTGHLNPMATRRPCFHPIRMGETERQTSHLRLSRKPRERARTRLQDHSRSSRETPRGPGRPVNRNEHRPGSSRTDTAEHYRRAQSAAD